jgi:hypothetical protein
MGWLGSLIAGAFLNIAGSLVGRVLTALGLGVISYTGFNASMTWAKTNAVASIQQLPAGVVGILSLLGVGSCISMVFSAMLIRATLQGMQSDTVKSWVKK